MEPNQQSGIEDEIRETETLEASSAVTDVPNVVARETNLFNENVAHTDTGIDVVNVIEIEYNPDIVVDVNPDNVVDIHVVNTVVDVDVDTHVDQ